MSVRAVLPPSGIIPAGAHVQKYISGGTIKFSITSDERDSVLMEQNIAGGNTQARFRIADGVAIQSGTDWACYYNYIFCRHVVMHNLD